MSVHNRSRIRIRAEVGVGGRDRSESNVSNDRHSTQHPEA